MADQFPDVEGVLKTWLKTQVALTAVVGERIVFGVTKGGFPQITIQRIGGGPDGSDALVDNALVQFSCWASSKGSAAETMSALVATLAAMGKINIDGTSMFGTTVDTVIWSPDQNDTPRYIVTALVTAIVVA